MPAKTQTINDPEFGEIVITRRNTRYTRIKLGTDGRFVVTSGRLVPLAFIRSFIERSREDLRKMAKASSVVQPYTEDQLIGKSHRLAVVPTQMVKQPEIRTVRDRLVVKLPPEFSLEDQDVQQQIRDEAIKILRRDAKKYLPPLLEDLAREHGFSYQRLRFSHAGSRWGSCSSNGTISLNIALMKLPDELVRYVLIHELCHTRHMNHSAAFWREVERYDSRYRLHRQQLKRETPVV